MLIVWYPTQRMSELNGKTIVLTGANRGIGRALAERFLAAGATLIASVRADDAAPTLEADLAAFRDRLTVERCDIAKEAEVEALRARVGARHSQIDVLVNNAGFFAPTDRSMHADDLDLGILRQTLDVNLFGTIAMCKAFAPLVPRGGRIINVSSTMGQLSDGGLPSYAVAYSVSKTALNAYTSSLAGALEPRGVLVDSLHPGWVQTDMGGPGAEITPEEGTETIYFLATRAAGETGKFWSEKRVVDW
ncbi:MAG: SDR family oxidoreductase [Candidatus Velthaea sp.]